MTERAGTSERAFLDDADAPALRQSLDTLVDAVDDGVFQLDADGRFVAVDDVVLEQSGYDPEQLLGEHVSVLLVDDGNAERRLSAPIDGPDRVGASVETVDGRRERWDVRVHPVEVDGAVRGTLGVVHDVTERSEQERDLARYETIVETVNDGVYVVDDEGRFTMVNRAYADLLGYDRAELLGEHVSLVVDDDVRQRARQAEAAMLGDVTQGATIEAELETADGDAVTAEATFAMLPGSDDRWHRVGVVRDVTERTERERTLERYERIVENLPVGVYRNTPGPDGEFVAANATLASIFDADSVEELLEHSVSDLYPDPERRAEFSERLQREGMVEDVELKQETLDGDTIWISVTAIRTVEDDEVYFDGIVQDITERRRTQQRLAEERDMFAGGPAVVFRWRNEEGWPVEYVSENVSDVLGYAPEELESGDVPYTDLLLEEEIDRIASEVEAASDETTERFSHEPYRVRTGDGDVRWVTDTTKIVRDDDEITRYLGYLVDVTERKEHERKLEESNERLEQFAYAASHDLQEPLRMVSSYLQLIERRYADQLDDDGREFIEFAVDGADRMRDMIQGLLAYARVDSQGDPFEPVDLDDVLAAVRDDLQVRIEDSGAEIEAAPLPRVEGDAGQLRQLFQNLLENAIEYSGDEPPRIAIAAERADARSNAADAVSGSETGDAAGGEWAISVSDDGIGVDPADADRIFDVFQSLDVPDGHSGTGIGLAICRRIVERHGGEIGVDAEPGEGATFTFTLPAADDPDDRE